jgi:hypothetical protein
MNEMQDKFELSSLNSKQLEDKVKQMNNVIFKLEEEN